MKSKNESKYSYRKKYLKDTMPARENWTTIVSADKCPSKVTCC